MKKMRGIKVLVVFLSAVACLSVVPSSVFAVTVSQLDQQIQQKKDAAANTAQQINNAADAITRISKDISTTEGDLSETQSKISQTQTSIDQLTKDLAQKDIELKDQKIKLNKAIVEIYRSSSKSDIQLLLGGSYLGEENNESKYLETIQIQVKSIYEKISQLKDSMEQQKSDEEKEKATLDELKSRQSGYLSNLDYQKDMSAKIKANAEGALGNYQKQIASLEAQKQSLLAAQSTIRSGGSNGGSDLVVSSPTSWYFSQRDPTWSSATIGNSDSTIGQYGCAVTSLAMVLRYYGSSVTPLSLASNSDYFYNDLIRWPSYDGHSLQRSNSSWSDVDNSLNQGHPVITKLNYSGGTHFVVIESKMSNGKYAILDPYFGVGTTYGKGVVAGFYYYW
jgi:peptidoglycan hydrolase CwlO-like protein